MHRGLSAAWRLLLPLIALLCLPACLVVVSTGPTSLTNATIVFVAIDDGGALVASLRITVVSIDDAWRDEGMTASDGAFRCNVGPGVGRVRAGVVPPPGYVLAGQQRWPREVDVSSGGSQQIEIRVQHAQED
jgi:hypothetical protein